MLTLSPVLLTLCGLLLAAVSALTAGGIAWGRFSGALETMRSDHRDLRDEVRRAVDAVSGLAVLTERVASMSSEITALRQRSHDAASAAARLEAELKAVRQTAERAADDARASHVTPAHGAPR